jgi:creatinine amidohydrolase
MRIADMNWMQLETYLNHDDRAVLPLGSTEQHAYLSLAVDNILAERVALDAAEPLGIPVFPPLNYGITPYFLAYPGSISLRLETYFKIIEDILNSLKGQGFKRILLVNGHGGNSPVEAFATEWTAQHPEMTVKLHNWWNAPKTLAKVKEIDPVASHASWMENFPWTRLAGIDLPQEQKPLVSFEKLAVLKPREIRDYLQEGNFGGEFQKDDGTMLTLWQVGVEETRVAMEGPW